MAHFLRGCRTLFKTHICLSLHRKETIFQIIRSGNRISCLYSSSYFFNTQLSRCWWNILERNLVTNSVPPPIVEDETLSILSELGITVDNKNSIDKLSSCSEPSPVITNVHLLYDLGITRDILKTCINKQPGLLRSSCVPVHIEFLQTINFTNEDIINILQRVPRFFVSSPNVVRDIVHYMLEVGVSMKNIRDVIKFSPSMFHRIKGRPQEIGNILISIIREHDPQADTASILAYIIRNDMKLFNRTARDVYINLKFLMELGLRNKSLVKIIHYCPSSLRIGTDFLQKRWTFLKENLQLNEEEVIECVMKHPRILTLSEDKLEERLVFIFEKLGFQPRQLLTHPRMLERSIPFLENRLTILQELNFEYTNPSIFLKSQNEFNTRIARIKKRSEETK